VRIALIITAFLLSACATTIDTAQPKGKQLPTAGEHIPPPSFLDSEELSNEKKESSYLDYRLEDKCGKNGAAGSYRIKPKACFSIYSPVCGCDGKTYGNSCAANGNGVSVMSIGECYQ